MALPTVAPTDVSEQLRNVTSSPRADRQRQTHYSEQLMTLQRCINRFEQTLPDQNENDTKNRANRGAIEASPQPRNEPGLSASNPVSIFGLVRNYFAARFQMLRVRFPPSK
jgi:hypothetical protein